MGYSRSRIVDADRADAGARRSTEGQGDQPSDRRPRASTRMTDRARSGVSRHHRTCRRCGRCSAAPSTGRLLTADDGRCSGLSAERRLARRRALHVGAQSVVLENADRRWARGGRRYRTELQAMRSSSARDVPRPRLGRVRSGSKHEVLDDDGNEMRRRAWSARSTCGRRPGSAPTYRYVARHRQEPRRVGARLRRSSATPSARPGGFLYLNDRRVDMFTVGGRNVYPAEIESALSAHPECVVLLGGWCRLTMTCGQVPYAIVQADGLDEAAVIRHSWPNASPLQGAPHGEFSDTPLRDDAGKARRSAVRDEIIARRQASTAASDARLSDRLGHVPDRAVQRRDCVAAAAILPAPQRDSARRLDQRVADRRDREAEHHASAPAPRACAR